MVRFSRMALRTAAAAAVTIALALVGGASATAAPSVAMPATATGGTPPRWALVDVGQRLCASPNDPRALYYFVVLDGTWPVPITAGYTGMPDGAEVYGPSTIPPGSGDGHNVQAFAAFRLNGAAPGRYVPKLWATDGAATQSVPVILDVRSTC